MKLLLLQTDMFASNEEGLAYLKAALSRHPDADIALLPELWTLGYENISLPETRAVEEGDETLSALSALAREHEVWLVAGSFPHRRRGELYNTSFVFDRQGGQAAAYDKLHLFRPLGEDAAFSAGEGPVTFETEWGKVGLSVCYDLRFGELYRRYAEEGCFLTLVPAQWPLARIAAWRILIAARAAENQFYAAGCNREGGAEPFGGGSMVANPWGEVVTELPQGNAGESVVEIDPSRVNKARELFSVLSDRRKELY